MTMYTADSTSGLSSCQQGRAGSGGLLTWAAVRVDVVLPARLFCDVFLVSAGYLCDLPSGFAVSQN